MDSSGWENEELQQDELIALESIFPPEEISIKSRDPPIILLRMAVSSSEGKSRDTTSPDDLIIELEITYSPDYPNVPASLSLDSNGLVLQEYSRAKILQWWRCESESLLGEPMIYTLIENLRPELVGLCEDSLHGGEEKKHTKIVENSAEAVQEKQPKLSKAQKNRMLKHTIKGRSYRGYDWVDIISHLSKVAQEATTE